MNIAIDIGHANGTGARGNGLQEHEVATAIAEHLAAAIRAAGHSAAIYDYPNLSNRADLNASIAAINNSSADLAVSIHCDCSDNINARGAHVCYVSGTGYRIAKAVAAKLCSLLPGRAEQVSLRSDLAILTRTHPAAILCECGFISNPADAQIQRSRPADIAAAIASGIINYITEG